MRLYLKGEERLSLIRRDRSYRGSQSEKNDPSTQEDSASSGWLWIIAALTTKTGGKILNGRSTDLNACLRYLTRKTDGALRVSNESLFYEPRWITSHKNSAQIVTLPTGIWRNTKSIPFLSSKISLGFHVFNLKKTARLELLLKLRYRPSRGNRASQDNSHHFIRIDFDVII